MVATFFCSLFGYVTYFCMWQVNELMNEGPLYTLRNAASSSVEVSFILCQKSNFYIHSPIMAIKHDLIAHFIPFFFCEIKNGCISRMACHYCYHFSNHVIATDAFDSGTYCRCYYRHRYPVTQVRQFRNLLKSIIMFVCCQRVLWSMKTRIMFSDKLVIGYRVALC